MPDRMERHLATAPSTMGNQSNSAQAAKRRLLCPVACHSWHAIKPPTQKTKKRNNMKLEIDWAGMLKAAMKAVWPFIAGAVGGIFSGCTVGGIGPNFL